MANHFNKLTPAEAERLALLAEEMGEALQIIGKVLRHGYESHNPMLNEGTNRAMLTKELGDVTAAMTMMTDAGDLSRGAIHDRAKRKIEKVGVWMHHQNDGERNA